MGNSFKALNLKREDIVVSTKIYWTSMGGMLGKPQPKNSVGLSRKHIIEGTRNSLKRLQLSYVDVIFAHRPDLETPLEETCRAFSWVIEKGYALYWGTSEWSPARIIEAIKLCEELGLHAPVAEQC